MGRDGKELIFIADRDMEQAQDKCGQVVRRSCDVIVVVVARPFLFTSVSTSVWHPDNVGTFHVFSAVVDFIKFQVPVLANVQH